MVIIINKYFILVLIAEIVNVLISDNTHILWNSVEREIYFDSWLSLLMILQLSRGFMISEK